MNTKANILLVVIILGIPILAHSALPQQITGIPEWDNILIPWLGTPYLYGGSSKHGTDCSGFVSSVYMEKEGLYLPRTAAEEFKVGTSVSKSGLEVGDLVFFKDRG
jgi:cell wall-associated NlpC family hydrolase